MEQSVNQIFIDYVEQLKEHRGVAFSQIAKRIGVPKQKVIDIRHGRSTADLGMLTALKDAYPELKDGELAPKTKVEERMEWLERENAKLRSENEELRNRLLKLADKLLEK